MAEFTYAARDANGRMHRGTMHAGSAPELSAQLRDRGWLVLDVKVAATRQSDLSALNPRNWLPVRGIDIELALQQISVMLRSGLTLLTALNTTAEQADRPRLAKILRRIIYRIQAGSSFGDALAEHKCFGDIVVQLVRVGEQTGNLDTVLVRSAESMARSRELKSQVIHALSYPMIVLFAALGVTVFMIVSVIPKLRVFVTAMGRKIPPSTELLVNLSNWFQIHGFTFLFSVMGFCGMIAALYMWAPGRLAIDGFLLRVPLLGKVFRVAGTALFARALGLMLRSGVVLLEALRTLEELGGNRRLREVVIASRQRVLAGGSLADALSEPHTFMPMLPQMIAVGESAGTLDDVLDEVAKFHEARLAALIKQISALAEPAVIVFVGGIVGYVYITFFLALYSFAGKR